MLQAVNGAVSVMRARAQPLPVEGWRQLSVRNGAPQQGRPRTIHNLFRIGAGGTLAAAHPPACSCRPGGEVAMWSSFVLLVEGSGRVRRDAGPPKSRAY